VIPAGDAAGDVAGSGGALAGLRIADFGRVLAAPYATMLLADLGAEVVKVERPGVGDETRSWGPPWGSGRDDGASTYFLSVNRNKTSQVLDLGSQEGRATAHDLVAGCDVVVQNFRGGTMERFGLGYAQLAATRPDLVYCSVTGFGPGSDLAGYDLVVQAVGGLMSLTGPDAEHPSKVGVALVDVITGMHACVGILAALRHRDATGHGQHVEVDLLSSLLSALTNQATAWLETGVAPTPMGNRHPSIAPYEVFRTADRPLAVAAANDGLFARLADVLGLTGLVTDPRFATNAARVAHREELVALLDGVLATRDADTWFAALSAAGVPCGPINDLGQAFALAEQLGLSPVADVGGVRTPAHPVKLSATPATYRTPPPSLG
jgi:crotonobetainyl-CoA:carnitine CoA-transferase CaiB-like acyl-CoA transferase